MADRICSVPGCANPSDARGWCPAHYARWQRLGDPVGIAPRSVPEVRFRRLFQCDPSSGCWLWSGHRNGGGYGQFSINNRTRIAHRVAYELFVGPIPDGLVLDHLCRVRHCVNPEHLEPVTQKENARRGETGSNMACRTHCPQGHPLSGPNLYIDTRGTRECRECRRVRRRAWRKRQREALRGAV